ncbi:RagB/SusD family nutrient uptake outer membrane protein [Prolixibacteraceae bacterium JC049]|nr:RagB/SusD family nutrient uptake outer membrane protein [Prolixibacteraceae bacterium JC049]
MKDITKIIIIAIAALLFACEDIKLSGEFLDQTPDQIGFVQDSIFANEQTADRVLTRAYSFARFPFFSEFNPPRMQGAGKGTLEGITDLGINYANTNAKNQYYTGLYNAGLGSGAGVYPYLGNGAWDAIRYAYIYLENVDKVPDMTEEQKRARKGEAHCLIAWRYIDLLRNYGGVPWIDKAYRVDEIPETLQRETVESLVNKIVALLDLAASELPWNNTSQTDYMRFNKASAMALKLRVLLFAASPLFNASEPYHSQGDEYSWYGNYDAARWDRAKTAGEDFINQLNANGYYELVQASGTNHRDYRQAFIDGYMTRGKKESLANMTAFKSRGEDVERVWADIIFTSWPSRQIAQTLEYINMFPMRDGSDFPADFDWSNPPFNPFYNESGEPTRDPRLYETAYINGDYVGTRTVEMWGSGNGFKKGRDLLNDTRTSFKIRKFILENNNATNRRKPIQFSIMRLPDVFLCYAEAINESNGGPNATAYDMVNRVRARVGLNDLPAGLNQQQFREAILKERALEFGYEESRWYDLIRWKRNDILQKALTGLKIKKTRTQGVFEYSTYSLPGRYWEENWDSKWYLSAFPSSEVDKNYGLTQNPGW